MDVSVDMIGWFHSVDHLPEKLWASQPRPRPYLVSNTWSLVSLRFVQYKFLNRPRGGPWVIRISHAGSDDHT